MDHHGDGPNGPNEPIPADASAEATIEPSEPRDSGQPPPDGPDAAADALARARGRAVELGLRPGMKPRRRVRLPDGSVRPADGAREPSAIGDQVQRLVAEFEWTADLSVGSVIGRWPQIVGPQVAEHVRPVSFEAGVLVLQADSTAWATNTKMMTSRFLARINEEAGPGTVAELRILGPSAPSWRRGRLNSADGRGPRDTYG